MKKTVIIKELILVLVTIIWGMGFIAQSIGGSFLDVYSFNLFRNIIASISLILFIIISRFIRKKKGNIVKIKLFESNKKALFLGGGLAGIFLAIAMTFQQLGINLEGAGRSGFLTALYIIFVPIIGIFFKKKLSPFIVISILLALTGLYLINVTEEGFSFSTGTIFLILCALSYSGQILAIDKYAKDVNALELSLVQFGVASILLIPFACFFGSFNFAAFTKALPAILYLGVISSCVAYTLQIYAQTEVNVTIACIIMSLESVFSLLFGVIFLKETHGVLEVFGCITIFAAVVLSQIDLERLLLNKSRKNE